MNKKSFHPRTRELRKIMSDLEMTTADIAEVVGCTRQAVKRWSAELTLIPKPKLRLLKLELRLH